MQEFSAKRDALFACLDDASKELKGTALDQSRAKPYTIKGTKQVMHYRQGRSIEQGNDSGDDDEKLRRLVGKESIFKKPEMPLARCLKPRKTPDYQVNPHKWKKYSLSDVDISDQTNSAAALSFLREMDAQRDREAVEEDDRDNEAGKGHKIEFKKKSKLNRNLKQLKETEVEDVEMDKPQLRGSKVLMPEYVIGQKTSKKSKKPQSSSQNRAAGKLQLSHLEEIDEDDE
ncbi:hypothetical protein KR215_002002 [Drosophila sulfurigaster]|nr:hypothetical protein KR215_002002 [Drosophila sulfurigaster]